MEIARVSDAGASRCVVSAFRHGNTTAPGKREGPCVGGRGLRPGQQELFREQGVRFRRQGLLPGQPDEEEDFVQ